MLEERFGAERHRGPGDEAGAAHPASGRRGLGRGLALTAAWLGLGSNVGDRLENLRSAAARLDAHEGIRLEAASAVYETEPVGAVLDQRDFLNAVARIATTLEPLELLDACKQIERELGRTAGPRHGPRPIDLDVLLVGEEVLHSERLRLPHPEVASRRFVLVPLLELDPPGAEELRAALAALPPGQRVDRVWRADPVDNRAPMLLTIDVGNTQTHVGAFDGADLVEHWRFSTDRQSTGDELAVVMHNLLALRGIGFDQIHGEAVSSVVPRLVSEYRHMFERYLEREALIVGPGTKTGMPILLENPHELGPDRLVNAVAGYEICGDACVIVDFGTAINYDVVSGAGEYLGGIISPGIEISIEALTSRAARLTKVDIAEPRSLIGKSTEAAVQSGIVYGFAAQVDGICGKLRAELGDSVTTIATGGMASVIVGFSDSIDLVDDLLTLKGLRLVYERNS